jgi:hypothetical protein
MFLQPAPFLIDCSIMPKSSLSTAAVTASNLNQNVPPRSAPHPPVQAQIRHKRFPPYGLPQHLFRFGLELENAPRRSGHRSLHFDLCSLPFEELTQNQTQKTIPLNVTCELFLLPLSTQKVAGFDSTITGWF